MIDFYEKIEQLKQFKFEKFDCFKQILRVLIF